jgi:hypothetical protein
MQAGDEDEDEDEDEDKRDADRGHREGSCPFHAYRYCAEMGVVADSGLMPRAARMDQAVVPVCSEA